MTTKQLVKAVSDGLAAGKKVIDTLRESGEPSMAQMKAIAVIRTASPEFWKWDADMAGTKQKIDGLLDVIED